MSSLGCIGLLIVATIISIGVAILRALVGGFFAWIAWNYIVIGNAPFDLPHTSLVFWFGLSFIIYLYVTPSHQSSSDKKG